MLQAHSMVRGLFGDIRPELGMRKQVDLNIARNVLCEWAGLLGWVALWTTRHRQYVDVVGDSQKASVSHCSGQRHHHGDNEFSVGKLGNRAHRQMPTDNIKSVVRPKSNACKCCVAVIPTHDYKFTVNDRPFFSPSSWRLSQCCERKIFLPIIGYALFAKQRNQLSSHVMVGF